MEEFEFTRYVVPLRDRMFRYAQSLLLCADEAEDVTHDLLERLWRERDRLDGCRDVASFVMVAVRNCCYDRFRSRQAGELCDLNAVRTIRRSRQHLMQEHHIALPFLDAHCGVE